MYYPLPNYFYVEQIHKILIFKNRFHFPKTASHDILQGNVFGITQILHIFLNYLYIHSGNKPTHQ